MPSGFDLTGPGLPQHLDGYEVSSNFFSTLGVNLAPGSSFSPDTDRIGGTPAAVISNRFWRERFHGRPAAGGRSIVLNGAAFVITGVLARGRLMAVAGEDPMPRSSSDAFCRGAACRARILDPSLAPNPVRIS